MPTFTTVDATWVNGVSNDDAELRRADTTMFLGDGSNNGVRGGIVRHGDNSLAVTVNGSDQLTIQPGAWVIPAATGLGVYRGALQAAVGPTAGTAIATRNATNPRIDLVVVQAPGIVKTIEGTPGASPSAPALPAQHIELARLNVPAVGGGAVTVDSTWRAYAASLGGDLYVESSARLPGSGNQKGQRAIALNTGLTHRWDGTAWLVDDALAGIVTGAITGSGNCYTRQGTGHIVMDVTAPTGAIADGTLLTTPHARYNPVVSVHGVLTDPTTNGAWLVRVTASGQVQTVTAMPAGKRILGTLTYPIAGV